MIRDICGDYKPYKIHPGVVLNILKFYTRRADGNDRVVGALLGSEKENFIEIRECFPIVRTPGKPDETSDEEFANTPGEETPNLEEKDFDSEMPSPAPSELSDISSVSTAKKKKKKKKKSAIDEQRAQNFYMLFRQLFPKQQLLGWFSTSTDMDPVDDLDITESFMKMTPKPVLLLVDPFSQREMTCIQFQKLTLKRVDVGMAHFPVSIGFIMNDNEKLALSQYMKYGKDMTKINELDLFKDEIGEMMNIIQKVEDFLLKDDESDEYCELKQEISRVQGLIYPHAELDDHFEEKLNSLLTMMYLTSICQSHVDILERVYKKSATTGQPLPVLKEKRGRRDYRERDRDHKKGDRDHRRGGDRRGGDRRGGDRRGGDRRGGDRRDRREYKKREYKKE